MKDAPDVALTREPETLASGIRQALDLLPPTGRWKLGLLVVANMATSILDLVGVLLVGALTWVLVAYSGEASTELPNISILDWTFSTENLVSVRGMAVLGVGAAAFLIAKSVSGTYLTRRTLRYLANRQAAASKELSDEVFRGPLTEIQKSPSQEVAFALLGGVNAAVVGLLGAAALALSEVALLVLLGFILLLVSPLVSIGAVVFFAALAVFMHRVLGSWAGATGRELSVTGYALTRWVQETISSFRELTVLNRMGAQSRSMEPMLDRSAHASATGTFIAQFPKYVYETALLLGALLLGAVLFATRPPGEAVATISIFLAAGSRILPSMLRLQNDIVSIRHSIGIAQPTFALAARFRDGGVLKDGRAQVRPSHGDESVVTPFVPTVSLDRVFARYPDSPDWALSDVSLVIKPGGRAALVGPTGSGKSTLVDVILGILPIQSGEVLIDGVPPLSAFSCWPGSVAYVPQSVSLVEGTVAQNVALGVPDEKIDRERVMKVLRDAHMLEDLDSQRMGIDTEVGERGVRLSGGQRQRLGIARALYSSPQLLVLDEATSALDAETELSITEMLAALQGQVTTIVVAHRLATIRDADEVLYVEGGRVIAQGSFDEVRQRVGHFAESARILGL